MLASAVAQPVPPLTQEQRTQLAAAEESGLPDEPALYPLLENVLTWDAEVAAEMAASGDAAGVTRPDYAALADRPSEYRGRLFMVEGRFAGRQRRQRLMRNGPWGSAVTEWGVVVDPKRGGGAERVAVVYLVDPTPSGQAPREGAWVRVVGRFYKFWEDRDASGRAVSYPVFVGRSPAVPEVRPAETPWRGLIVAGVLVLAGGMVVLRWWVYRPVRPRRRLRSARQSEAIAEAVDDLPRDPADAMARLEERASPRR